jgi:hypothetical protein
MTAIFADCGRDLRGTKDDMAYLGRHGRSPAKVLNTMLDVIVESLVNRKSEARLIL